MRGPCRSRFKRLLLAVTLVAAIAASSLVAVWASYGFRYSPSAGPGLKGVRNLSQDPGLRESAPLLAGAAVWSNSHRLLPEAYTEGFLASYRMAEHRPAYLMGGYSSRGWWYYFPLAMLFKTPLASLAGTLLAVAVLLLWRQNVQVCKNRLDAWTVLCLAVPFGLYGAFALRTNLNLGLRHVLPLYPFLFMVVGLGASRVWAWARWRKASRLVLAALATGLILESLAAFPNSLGFFNTACGGARGGLRLLGDSNLDWGQDLKLLAEWRRKNPSRKLYLCYFGMADPAYYGIDYVNLPGGYRYGPPVQPVTYPGIIAMSATHLQGIHLDPALRNYYAPLRQANPMTVLGSSIYLFDSTLLTGDAVSMQEQNLLAVSKQRGLHGGRREYKKVQPTYRGSVMPSFMRNQMKRLGYHGVYGASHS